MIDLHCHPLPGIDDGPTSTQQALAMLRRAVAADTRTMVATPRVSATYPHTSGLRVDSAARALQIEADAAGIDMRLVAGAELELMHREMLHADQLSALRLGDGPYTLVELPFTATAQFAEMLLGMHSDVQPAILAHPERCRAFHENPNLLASLVDRGMLVQITAASIAGDYGGTVRRSAWSMLEQGIVHVVASDAHDASRRPPLLREVLEEAGLGGLVATLCDEAPAAILAGECPPPAPPVTSPRSVRRRRLRDSVRRG